MSQSLRFGICCSAIALLVAAALPACSGSSEPSSPEDTGSLGLQLTTPGGVVLDAIDYTVSGNGITPITGSIDVSGSAATASIFVGALPASPAGAPLDYTVSMTSTSTDSVTTCTGQAKFDVVAGQTVGVTVPLTCGAPTTRGNATINGEFNSCPTFTSMIVAPLQTDLGKSIAVSAAAADTDTGNTLSFAWTATGGTFDNAAAASTKYNCTVGGVQNLTVTVDDGAGCATSLAVDVNCSTPFVCGDGVVQAGEQCDPPNGDDCSANCQNIVVACGNGIVQASGGEECDPPNGTSCDATCKNIVCGDGKVSGQEQCDPPADGICSSTCQNAAVCGDGIKAPSEECDPPAAGVCDASCNSIAPDLCYDATVGCTPAQCPAATDACNSVDPTNCNAILDCIESSNCADNSTRDGAECYCGSLDNDTCFNSFNPAVPQGVCKGVIEAAAGTNIPLQIGQVFFDLTTPVGAAFQTTSCQLSNCKTECGL